MTNPATATTAADKETTPYPSFGRSVAVWAIPAVFYLAGFYLRASPGPMTAELMRDFNISAGPLGNLSAMYFYAYVLMQIPTGVLVDSWGPRRLLIGGALMAAVGTVIFGTTSSFVVASLGRALIGASTAVAWVVTLKLATHWLPGQRFALIAGLSLFMGNVGALVAQVPLRMGVEHFGWRAVSLVSAVVVVAIAGIAFLFVKNDPSEEGAASYAPAVLQQQASLGGLLKAFPTIFTYRNTWLIFLAQGGTVGAVMSFTILWGPPFLKSAYGVTPTRATAICSIMTLSWAIASPLFGLASDRLKRRKLPYLTGAIVASCGWITLFMVPGLPLAVFTIVGAITAFACGGVIIGFPYAKESVPVRFLATVSGAINLGNMVGPMVLQPGIGWMLDRLWTGDAAGAARVYPVESFRIAFLLLIGWSVLTCVLISLTRDTRCQQNVDA